MTTTTWATWTAPNGVQYRAPAEETGHPLCPPRCEACGKPGRLGRPVRRGRHTACNFIRAKERA